jgi:hypothetical protein
LQAKGVYLMQAHGRNQIDTLRFKV